MNRNYLMMFGLLAAAPVASQAAMVEIDDAALSEVHGQASFTGLLGTFDALVELNPYTEFRAFSYINAANLDGAYTDVVPKIWPLFEF